jgi:branched-chain amino acid aminotransferase
MFSAHALHYSTGVFEGHIAEGSGECIFLIRDGKVLTNDERHSILLGITRDSILRIAQDLGYKVGLPTAG